MTTAAGPITNYNRKCLMVWAWDAKRSAPSRGFAACLCEAWVALRADIVRRAKAMLRLTKALRAGGRVTLSPSLIRSPSTNAFRAVAFGGALDRQAGAMISRIGH